MTIELPDFALVVLVGASGSGKSSFARAHFLPTEVLSSDQYRAIVSDDETDQSATTDAFDALHYLAGVRLRRRKLVVVDATNVQEGARKPLVDLARRYYAVPVAIVLDVPEAVCAERNAARPNRDFGRHVVTRHVKDLKRSLKNLKREGFRYVYHLDGVDAIDATTITRVPLWNDKRGETGAFDIIGDVHGCYDELTELLAKLGYVADEGGIPRHPDNRRPVFVGDIVDRGPQVVEAARLVMDMVGAGAAFCVCGNHDDKLKRALEGRKVTASHGLQESLDQIAALPVGDREAFTARYVAFAEGLLSHVWLDGGKLAVAHAGIKAEMIGRASGAIREFCLYGDTTGETGADGFPVRRDWAAEYRGEPFVVYGHTPVDAVRQVNNTANIDTGACFGGALSALRYPERGVVSVKSSVAPPPYPPAPFPPQTDERRLRGEKGEPEGTPGAGAVGVAPLAAPLCDAPPSPSGSPFSLADDVRPSAGGKGLGDRGGGAPDIADVTGRHTTQTRLAGNIVTLPGNNAAALEVMSRFAAHPRWLVYLPPTMSPVETAAADGFLEHPAEAFAYFGKHHVASVVCQEKHMGSRAVVVVCRSEDAARQRFGAQEGERNGAVLTRTGRPFTDDDVLHRAILAETARAIEAAGLWDELATDWLVLDAELMPWNAKAQGLLKEQYAPVAASGAVSLRAEVAAWEALAGRGIEGAESLRDAARERLSDLEAYRVAYGKYCWNVAGIGDLRVAPFHLLAAEGRTFLNEPHPYHIETLGRLADVSPLFQRTETLTVETGDADSVAAGIAWWLERTGRGAEGMVVKPLTFLPPKGCQPAVKVRGREYLRIIYGPEYTRPENLRRLRDRGLNAKRSLAAREFALGVEGLERFVAGDSLRRVHECAFAVLALESEAVDPRL